MRNKKITILYVLKILRTNSNKEHPISQALITRTLNLMGIKCDRKTIARDINCLIDFGYNIKKVKGGGCYMLSDYFEESEIALINLGISLLNVPSNEKAHLKAKMRKISNISKTDL